VEAAAEPADHEVEHRRRSVAPLPRDPRGRRLIAHPRQAVRLGVLDANEAVEPFRLALGYWRIDLRPDRARGRPVGRPGEGCPGIG